MMHEILKRGRTAPRVAVLVFLAVVMTACGENLFRTDIPPELVSFEASAASVVEGDTLTFTLDATGARAVEVVHLSLSGAFADDTTFAVPDPGTDVTATIELVVPENTGPGDQLTATATVVDELPDTSNARTVTVTVIDATPPTTSVTASPTEVGAGQTIDIEVTASDNRGLATMAAVVTDGAGYDTTLTATLTGAPVSRTQSFQLLAPGLDMGTLSVTSSVTDVNGLVASSTDGVTVAVVDEKGPTFLSLTTSPDSTIPLGTQLRVTVDLMDPNGLRQVTFVGLAYRGDPGMGTDSVVQRFAQKTITFPRPTEADTLPDRYTLYPLLEQTDSTISEPVTLFVTAEDSLGNVSTATKEMYVGGPNVSISWPQSDTFDIQVSDTFRVDVVILDAKGIREAQLRLLGAVDSIIDLPTNVEEWSQSIIAPGAPGEFTIQALAYNDDAVRGQSRTLLVRVLTSPPTDTAAPVVSVGASRSTPEVAGARMELLDTVTVEVSAFDDVSGLARVGTRIWVRRLVDTATIAGPDSAFAVITADAAFSASRDLETLQVDIPVLDLYAALGITDEAVLDSILPDSLVLGIHGFAVDEEGQPGCSTGTEQSADCKPGTVTAATFPFAASDSAGLQFRLQTVREHTVLLENRNALIADLAVDTTFDRLYLSNRSENLVEVLTLNTDFRLNAFRSPSVQVGSEPHGVFLGERVVSDSEVGFGGLSVVANDTLETLIVANSGGTNMSLVHLDPDVNNVQEVDVVRLNTDNAVLFEVSETQDEFGNVNYSVVYIDLADRPQFLAQDSLLRVVYSTIKTAESPFSSVRFVHVDPDPSSATDDPEVRFLLTSSMVNEESTTTVALANIDSLKIKPMVGVSDSVKVYTHQPGYPDSIIVNAQWEAQLADAVADVEAQIQAVMTPRGNGNQAAMFFPFLVRGTWDLGDLSWSDTTFVAASGDRGRIAIGEGASAPTGRIMLWHASQLPDLSSAIQMTDLTNNASEQVLGIGLNEDGSLGVARGRDATYFFDSNLRLQGLYQQEHQGGAGAAFHPDHDEIGDGGHTTSDGAGVAFSGTSEHSIDVVNTFHFNQVNSLVIRDNIVGPLVAGPPLDTDNGGQGGQCVVLAATEEALKNCVVAKLYGITAAGGVVVVNVRRRDLEPYSIE